MTTSSPSASAATTSSTVLTRERTPSTTRSRPERSLGRHDVLVAEVAEHPRDASRVAGRDLEHERATFPEDVARAARDRFRRTDADERLARLPVAHLRLERVDLVGQHVRRIRHDEIPRPVRKPAIEIPLTQRDREPRSRGVGAGHLQRAGRGVDRGHPSSGMLVGDARGRSRHSRSRRRARVARAQPKVARGTARRRPPSRGAERGRAGRRRASGDGSPTRRARTRAARARHVVPRAARAPSPRRARACETSRARAASALTPRTWATRISASTRGVSQPASVRRSDVSASARPTFTPKRRRAPVAAPRRAAPRSARPCRRRAPGRGGAP